MPLSKARRDFIAYRREVVGQLRARGLTEREIAERLPKLGIVDPDTGEAFSNVTVHTDCKANLKEWQANRLKAIDEHIARQLAELTEMKRGAMDAGNLAVWATLNAQEMKLLGTAAPDKVAPTDPTGEREYNPESMPPSEIAARVIALLGKANEQSENEQREDSSAVG